MSRLKDLKGSAEHLKLIRRNIEINAARADRQYAKDHKMAEAPEEVKKYHRKQFENAEYERERQER